MEMSVRDWVKTLPQGVAEKVEPVVVAFESLAMFDLYMIDDLMLLGSREIASTLNVDAGLVAVLQGHYKSIRPQSDQKIMNTKPVVSGSGHALISRRYQPLQISAFIVKLFKSGILDTDQLSKHFGMPVCWQFVPQSRFHSFAACGRLQVLD